MITTLLFDFYGVFQPDPYKQWLSQNNLKRVGVYKDISTQLDIGQLSQDDFLTRLEDESGVSIKYNDFYREDNLNNDLIELVKQLKKTYRIGLLSNASSTLRQKLIHNDLVTLFDYILISSEIGYAKPDRNVYSLALEKIKSEPEEIVFIDDNSKYTKAASESGMDVCVFKDTISFREQLVVMGLM